MAKKTISKGNEKRKGVTPAKPKKKINWQLFFFSVLAVIIIISWILSTVVTI
jgi:cytoskeletal protein RodZ